MHRQLLEHCTPALVALGAGFLVLLVLARLGPARFDWRRLLDLHRCERGGVQSLAFVLVLPIFMTITVFIVQVSQILIGMMVVNHASFAGARAASVWIPAYLDTYEPTNVVDPGYLVSPVDDGNQFVTTVAIDELAWNTSPKLARIRTAVVAACAQVSPSRSLSLPSPSPDTIRALDVARRVYPQLVPSSRANGATDRRLVNKFTYSDHHTLVVVEWRDTDRNTRKGPTYNPFDHPDPDIVFDPNEVGWQDAITVHVVHRYALISGAGSMFAGRLSGWQQLPPRVLSEIPDAWKVNGVGDGGQPVVLLTASTTITNEGLKPVRFHNLD